MIFCIATDRLHLTLVMPPVKPELPGRLEGRVAEPMERPYITEEGFHNIARTAIPAVAGDGHSGLP